MEGLGHTPEHAALPEPLPVNFENIPEQLRGIHHWVVWKYTTNSEGEIKKPPFVPTTGRFASVRNPSTWGSFAEAQAAYQTGRYKGVGLVLTDDMGIVGVDLDHCVQEQQITNEESQIITTLGTYAEYSPSGNGIRLFLIGKIPGPYRRKGNVEMYQDQRYLTVTGQRIPDTPPTIEDRQQALTSVYTKLFPPSPKLQVGGGWGATAPSIRVDVQAGGKEEISEEALQDTLRKALRARNGREFQRYYEGDTSLWEGEGAKHKSQSEADFTLVLRLLYWTKDNIQQTDQLFRRSGLMRDKWDQRRGTTTYGSKVIEDALTFRRKQRGNA